MNESGEAMASQGNTSFFGSLTFWEVYWDDGIVAFLLIALVVLVIFTSRAKREQIPRYYSFIDRFGIMCFLYACLISSLTLCDDLTKVATVTGKAVIPFTALLVSEACWKFALPCAVALLAVITSGIFRWTEKQSASSDAK